MNQTMRLPIILSALVALSAAVSAKDPDKSEASAQGITLAKVVSDLERKGEELSRESLAIRAEGKDAGKSLVDKKKSEAFRAITQHLIKRRNLLSNKAVPSDPHYAAIQRQMLAQCHLESLEVWWSHCRKGTDFESMAAIKDLALWTELTQEKTSADQLVSEKQPVAESSQTNETKSVDPVILKRIKGGNSILDQIDGWKELPEESKSKIISR